MGGSRPKVLEEGADGAGSPADRSTSCAARHAQRIPYRGKRDILASSGKNILVFALICQKIWEAWIQQTDASSASTTVPRPLPNWRQDEGSRHVASRKDPLSARSLWAEADFARNLSLWNCLSAKGNSCRNWIHTATGLQRRCGCCDNKRAGIDEYLLRATWWSKLLFSGLGWIQCSVRREWTRPDDVRTSDLSEHGLSAFAEAMTDFSLDAAQGTVSSEKTQRQQNQGTQIIHVIQSAALSAFERLLPIKRHSDGILRKLNLGYGGKLE